LATSQIGKDSNTNKGDSKEEWVLDNTTLAEDKVQEELNHFQWERDLFVSASVVMVNGMPVMVVYEDNAGREHETGKNKAVRPENDTVSKKIQSGRDGRPKEEDEPIVAANCGDENLEE